MVEKRRVLTGSSLMGLTSAQRLKKSFLKFRHTDKVDLLRSYQTLNDDRFSRRCYISHV